MNVAWPDDCGSTRDKRSSAMHIRVYSNINTAVQSRYQDVKRSVPGVVQGIYQRSTGMEFVSDL